MLQIKNLHANINGKEILKGINLTVKPGEVHAIMGPNGSGKSTLSSVLVGNPAFEVTEGEVIFNGKNVLELSPEDRSREGMFLSFQYPVEIPGVSMVNFMRAAVNAHREYKGLPPVSATDFLKLMREKRAIVELDNKLASRHHAVIQKIRDSYFIRDEKSTNGTFVNGRRIPEGKYFRLNKGDKITIGTMNLVIS